MKKIVLVFPIVALLAVSCNSSPQTFVPTQPTSKILTTKPQVLPNLTSTFNATSTQGGIKIFANLPEILLQKNSNILLTPSKGFLITTSILSHKKDQIVYSEISDCIIAINQYDAANQNQCGKWNFTILVKDLIKNNTRTIFKYPAPNSFPLSTLDLIPTVYAGGCEVVPFPLAWSPNDTKIILEWGNPTSCGSWGAPRYLTYTINPDGSQLSGLATYDGIFYSNYNKIIYSDYSSKSPAICSPGGDNNSGKVAVKEIETGKIKTLLEAPDTSYTIASVSADEKMLNYTSSAIKVTDTQQNCGNTTQSNKQMQIALP